MDSTHAAVGIGAGGSVGVLTGLIAGTWHLDPNLAADWAMAVVGIAGFAGGWITWFIRWKWPSAPPLPGDELPLPIPNILQGLEPRPAAPAGTTAFTASPATHTEPASLVPTAILPTGATP